ncbi:MAG: hypothetical protein Q7T41_02750 [Candidatus Saccharibacteria bacterium]|nr:hypothetical protein [Candidatus Saccharibacteria bacterium]
MVTNFNGSATAACSFGDVPMQTATVNIPATGEYRVWTRYKSDTLDTLNIEINGNCSSVVIQPSVNQWLWTNKKTDNQAFQHTFSTVGNHTLKFSLQTGGASIDKFGFLALGSICSDNSSEPKNFGDNCTIPPSTTSTPNTGQPGGSQATTPPVSGTTKLPETSLPLVNSNNSQATKINYYVNGSLVASTTPGQETSVLDTTKLTNGQYTLKTEVVYSDGTTATEEKQIKVDNPIWTVAFARYAKWFKYIAIILTAILSWYGITSLLRYFHNRKIYLVAHGIDKNYLSRIPDDPGVFKQKMYTIAIISTIAFNSLVFIPINRLFATLNNNYYTVEAESASTSDGSLVKKITDLSVSGGSYLRIDKKAPPVVQTCPAGQTGTPPNCAVPPVATAIKRPFSDSSVWNTPIPANTTWYDHNLLHYMDDGSFRHWYVNEGSMRIWHTNSNDPLCTWQMPSFIDPTFNRNRPAETFTFRCPAAMVPGTDEDHILFVVDDNTNEYVEVWQAVRSGSTITGQGWARGNLKTGTGIGSLVSAGGNNAGVRAANFSWAGGLITGDDLSAASIDHALVIALGWGTLSNTTWRSPATAPDNGGHSGPFAMGTRFGIPANTPKPAGLSPLGSKVFDTLKKYGALVGDFAGTSYPMFYIDSGSVNPGDTHQLFVWWNSYTADMDIIGPLVRVADYQP